MPANNYAPGDRVEMVCTHYTCHGVVIETDVSRDSVLIEWDEHPGTVTEYRATRDPGDYILRKVAG